MKKSKKKAGFIIGGVAMAAILGVTGVSLYANAATKVNSYVAENTDISQVLELNGTVRSDRVENIFANVDGKIATINVKPGDAVKKGDLLISFDEERIDYLIAMTEYDAQSALGNYRNSVEMGNRTQALYNEATINLDVLNKQIADTETAIAEKQKQLTEKKAKLAGEGVRLQVDMMDKAADPNAQKEYQNLQKEALNNAYAQEANSEILALQEEISKLSTDLANFKEYKAEMTSQKAATATTRMTAGQKEQMEAMKAASELSAEETIKNLESLRDGIRAEFDGIVTSVNVTEGAEVARGMQLFTIESSSDIIIKCAVNKYDIVSVKEGQSAEVTIGRNNYTGKVVRVEKMVGSDASLATGIGVDILLDNPDGEIILGMDVKPRLSCAAAEDVISIPKEALNEEDDDAYVFVVENKKATRKKVETGIRNDDMIEVTSGLCAGDTVVWNSDANLKDGMEVKGY